LSTDLFSNMTQVLMSADIAMRELSKITPKL